MEGLLGASPRRTSLYVEACHEARMRHRWIAFLFMTMMVVVSMIYLSTLAFSI